MGLDRRYYNIPKSLARQIRKSLPAAQTIQGSGASFITVIYRPCLASRSAFRRSDNSNPFRGAEA